MALELHRLSGLAVATCQRVLGEGRAMRLAGWIIEAHVRAGELGPVFVQRLEPIERALGGVPCEEYSAALEEREQAVDGAENLEQTRYQAAPTEANARARIRINHANIAKLQQLNRALARRHGFVL